MITAPVLPFNIHDPEHTVIWLNATPHLERVIPILQGTHELVDVLSMIVSGSLQLWPGDRAACVTEINIFPRLRACNVFLVGSAGGGLREVQDWTAERGPLERWAFDEMNCDRITTTGREGLFRTMGRMERHGGFFVRTKHG